MSDEQKDSAKFKLPTTNDGAYNSTVDIDMAKDDKGGKSLKLLGPGSHAWRLKDWLNERLTKKQMIIGGTTFVLLLGAAVAFALNSLASAPVAPTVAQEQPKPVFTSPLTGLRVSETQSKHIVTGVMIENSDFARPQSGLRQAGVVFEAIAEAGITRFLALYQEATPGNIGPIRSIRPYYLQWDLGFDAPLAHVGGSPDAMHSVGPWHVKNLDEFFNAAYYHRISSREAPHNVYTGMSQLNKLEKTKGWHTSKFVGFPRKPDSPSKNPRATSIDFAISSEDFHVHYKYDTQANAYWRWEGGAKHLDAGSGKQLEPKVVIAIVVPLAQGALDASGAYYSNYAAIGGGKAYVFQDGTVTVGTWKKTSRNSQIQFLMPNGQPIKLNAGQTWISAVATASQVAYHGPSTAAKN